MRSPGWRKKDAAGALGMSPDDARRLGTVSDSTFQKRAAKPRLARRHAWSLSSRRRARYGALPTLKSSKSTSESPDDQSPQPPIGGASTSRFNRS